MYLSKNDKLSRIWNDFLDAKVSFANRAYKAVKNNRADKNARLDALTDFLKNFGDKYCLFELDKAKQYLKESNGGKQQTLKILNQIGGEIEIVTNMYIIQRHLDKKTGVLDVTILDRNANSHKYRYDTVHCYFQNPFNMKQLMKAPIKKHFTIHIYDFYNVGYAYLKHYQHNPIKNQKLNTIKED